jgi:hypothetical protein
MEGEKFMILGRPYTHYSRRVQDPDFQPNFDDFHFINIKALTKSIQCFFLWIIDSIKRSILSVSVREIVLMRGDKKSSISSISIDLTSVFQS